MRLPDVVEPELQEREPISWELKIGGREVRTNVVGASSPSSPVTHTRGKTPDRSSPLTSSICPSAQLSSYN